MEINFNGHTVYLRTAAEATGVEKAQGWIVTLAEPTVGGSLNHEEFTTYKDALREFAATILSITEA